MKRLALAAYGVALLVWSATVGVPNDPIGIAIWLWLLVVCVRGTWSLDFWRDWWPWLAALAFYALARGLVDDWGFTPHVELPVRIDTWLGGGEVPTVRLQRAFLTDQVHWYDVAASVVYASHFLVAFLLAGALWWRDRTAFRAWFRRYVVLSYLALVGYVVFPMAPPWLASREGFLPHVARVSRRGLDALDVHRQSMVWGGLPNQTAAMPSLHTGVSCLVAYWTVTRLRSRWRWLVLAYPLAMTTTLVYSGEHYVVDAIAGAAVAGLAMVLSAWWERRPSRSTAAPHPASR